MRSNHCFVPEGASQSCQRRPRPATIVSPGPTALYRVMSRGDSGKVIAEGGAGLPQGSGRGVREESDLRPV